MNFKAWKVCLPSLFFVDNRKMNELFFNYVVAASPFRVPTVFFRGLPTEAVVVEKGYG